MIKTIVVILEIAILMVTLKFLVDVPRELNLINHNLAQINQSIQEQNKIFGFNSEVVTDDRHNNSRV